MQSNGNDSSARVSLADVASEFWWPIYGEVRDAGNPSEAAALTGRLWDVWLPDLHSCVMRTGPRGVFVFSNRKLKLVMEQARSGRRGSGAPPDSPWDPSLAGERDDYGRLMPSAAVSERWATVVLSRFLNGIRQRAEGRPWSSSEALIRSLPGALIGIQTLCRGSRCERVSNLAAFRMISST